MQLMMRSNKMYTEFTSTFPDFTVPHVVPTIYTFEDIARH